MSTSNELARLSGVLSVVNDYLSTAMTNATSHETDLVSGLQIIEGVYDILADGQSLESHEIGELADMLHEGIQRVRGVRTEPVDARERRAA